jgi:metal-responsive CopG/Arc/MetJ family transcriptional regulator
MRVITFKIDEDMLYMLDHLCVRLRKSRSEVIREALKVYINHLMSREVRRFNVKEVVRLG